jgi:hypothetical protein
MRCHRIVLIYGALYLGVPLAMAQMPADPIVQAQQRYAREVASCNSGALAAPDREACIRVAGQQLDRARGLPPVDAPVTTPDGRATVVQPEGVASPAGTSATDTSRDGRATVVR